MPNRPWLQEEVDQLKILFFEGNIPNIPNRSSKSVRRKLISLGLLFPKFKVSKHKKVKWTSEEIDLLKKGVRKIKGRTQESVRSMVLKLRLSIPNTYKRPWPKEQEELLIELVKQGKTAKSIFEMKVLPYSKNSIQKKMCYMNITNKRPCNKLSFIEKSILKKFLIENWEGKTPEDLVFIWNQKPYFKVNKSKVVYYLNDLGIKIPYNEVAKINNQRKKEQTIKQKSHISSKELENKIRLSRIEFMKKRVSERRDIWTGVVLEEEVELEV